jgi:hypothetical protein
MKNLLIGFGILSLALSGCSSPFDKSIDQLIELKRESNRMILQETEKFEEIHQRLAAIEAKVSSFLMDLERIPKSERIAVVREFADKNLNGLHPGIEINEGMPLSILKLVLIDKTNLIFREWQKDATYKFDTLAPTVVFDKVYFQRGEAITGRMYLMAYNTQMVPQMKVDGKLIDVKDGVGRFSFVPGKESGEFPVDITLGNTRYRAAIKY